MTELVPTTQRAESLAKAWEAAEWPHEAPVLRAIAMPSDTNPEGDIFGGWLLSQMDLAAASVAFHRAAGRCATIAIDGMTFISPVFVGDEVSLFARVVTIAAVSISSPFGPVQVSHNPAKAIGPPAFGRTKYGCLRAPAAFHS